MSFPNLSAFPDKLEASIVLCFYELVGWLGKKYALKIIILNNCYLDAMCLYLLYWVICCNIRCYTVIIEWHYRKVMSILMNQRRGSMTFRFLVYLIFCSKLRYIFMYNRSTLIVPLLNRMMYSVIEVVALSKRMGVMWECMHWTRSNMDTFWKWSLMLRRYSTQFFYVILRLERFVQICLLCICTLTESFGDDLSRSNILDNVRSCAWWMSLYKCSIRNLPISLWDSLFKYICIGLDSRKRNL